MADYFETIKRAVWNKGREIPGYHADEWRYDKYENLIRWSHYGNRHSLYGWEIHHILASAHGGGDSLANLEPLHWRTNARLGGRLS